MYTWQITPMIVNIGLRHCVNDHVLFGEKTMYYLQREVTDVILDLHVNR